MTVDGPAEDDPAVGAGRLVLVVGRALEHHVDDRRQLRVEQDVERLLAKPGHGGQGIGGAATAPIRVPIARCGARGLGSPFPRSISRAVRVPTFTPKPSDIARAWHVVDADGLVLGRLATQVATLLRGKHKPIWAPHVDTGDHVIVVNASKLDLSPRKLADKRYHRHSGYPGGLTAESLEHLLARDPERVVRLAVKGMLPKGRLGRRMIKKLKVYGGPTHPARGAAAAGVRAHVERAALEQLTNGQQEHSLSKPLIQTTGRRKEAVARVRLRAGSGIIRSTAGRSSSTSRSSRTAVVALEPLRLTQTADVYDVDATLDGGGVSGQAGALRLGIARALVALDDEVRPQLKKAGLLTRDAREKERRKYGLKKARKAPQYSKR